MTSRSFHTLFLHQDHPPTRAWDVLRANKLIVSALFKYRFWVAVQIKEALLLRKMSRSHTQAIQISQHNESHWQRDDILVDGTKIPIDKSELWLNGEQFDLWVIWFFKSLAHSSPLNSKATLKSFPCTATVLILALMHIFRILWFSHPQRLTNVPVSHCLSLGNGFCMNSMRFRAR